MTLKSLKSNLKYSLIVLILVLYSAGFYFLGRLTINSSLKIKWPIGDSARHKIEMPTGSPLPNDDMQSANVIASNVKLCSNTVYGFEVTYPKDWFTTYNEDKEKCTFFAPFSFVVPRDTNKQFVPITIEVVNNTKWEETVKFYENPNDFQNIVSTQSTQVASRAVQVVRAITTGNGSLPKNFVKTSYLIFSTGKSYVISYNQADEKENTKNYEDIINEMVESLRAF